MLTTSKNLLLWDITTGEGELVGESSLQVTGGITFSPDGSRILAAGLLDDIVRVWDVATLKCLGEFHQHRYYGVRCYWSPCGHGDRR